MNYNIVTEGNIIKVVLEGSVDTTAIKEFKEKIAEVSDNNDLPLELDLENVEYLDSSGMGLLLNLYKGQKLKGLEFTITKASDSVMGLLKLSSLVEVLKN